MTVRRLTGSKRAITTTISVIAFLVLALPATASAITTTWTGATDTNWDTNSNWDNGQPTAADTAVINNTSTNNPVVSTADEVASAVNLSGSKTLTVGAGGELDVGGQITAPVGTNVSLTGGHLQVGTLLIDNAAGLTLTSGAIAGTLNATSPVTVTNAGVTYGTTVSTSDGFTLGNNISVTQTASINMSDSHFLAIGNHLYTLADVNLTETAASGPTISIGSGGTLFHNGNLNNVVQPQINSDGTIHTDPGAGSLTLVSNGGGNANQIGGTLEAAGNGWLFLQSAGVGDTWTVKSGGVTVNNDFGRVEVRSFGDGTFFLNNQTVRMNGDFTWDGTSGGLFSGTGTLDAVSPNFGEFLINDGNFADSANVTIPSDTTAQVLDDTDWTNTFTFNVNGLLRINDSDLTASDGSDTPLINISSSGELDHINGDGLVEPRVVSTNGTIEDQNSTGTLNLERVVGQTNLYSGTMRTTGGGDLRLGTEVHRLQGALTMDTSQGGTIRTGGSADLQLNSNTLTLVGSSLDHASGAISGTGTINGPGTLFVTGGDFAGGGALTVNAPTIQSNSTNVAGAGSELRIGGGWTANGNITYTGTGGTFVNVLSSGTLFHTSGSNTVFAPLTVSGAVDVEDSDLDLSGGTTITSSGQVDVDNGQLDINPLSNLSGTTLNSNGSYRIGPSGVLRFPGPINTLDADMRIEDGGQVLVDPTNAAAFANLGTLNGSLTFTDGHTEDVAANLFVNGTLAGNGTVIGNVVNNNGVVSPGTSPGEFFVVGNYSQGGGGRLDIEVAGVDPGEFDVLDIDGDVILNGELALLPIDGFDSSAEPGDRAPFLRYTGGRSGEFDATTVNPPLSNGKPFTADYVDAGLRVDAVVGEEPPDTQAPTVTITKKKISQEKRDAKFKFTANEAGTTFECKLDKRPWRTCSSPRNYGNLDVGKHKFRLRGTDPSGNVSAVAKKKFKIRDV